MTTTSVNRPLEEKLLPYFAPSSLAPPTPQDEASTAALEAYLNTVAPLETAEGTNAREEMLVELRRLATRWIRNLSKKRGFEGTDEDNIPKGQLFVSGSYRLGVNQKDADVDTVLVVPHHITREDFFDESLENGFVGALRNESERVTHVLPIPSAKVPICEVVWNGIELDVLFARLQHGVPMPTKPDDLLDDNILLRTDEATVLSLNGPRVTELLVKFVQGDAYKTFLTVLRSLRLWAKRRGIYSNKMGFLGGVNFAILAVFALQLWPKETASRVLARLMTLLSSWKWPAPIRLCQPYKLKEDIARMSYDDDVGQILRARMPIITPAYPNFNSSLNVTQATLAVMQKEFARAKAEVDRVLKRKTEWASLFTESDFFVRYKVYVSVAAVIDLSALTLSSSSVGEENEEEEGNGGEGRRRAVGEHTLKKWGGFVESRVRKLVETLELDTKIPLSEVFPFPAAFEYSEGGLQRPLREDDGDDNRGVTKSSKIGKRWFLGVRLNPFQLLGDRAKLNSSSSSSSNGTGGENDAAEASGGGGVPLINLHGVVDQFVNSLAMFERTSGMEVEVRVFTFRGMLEAFPTIYPSERVESLVSQHRELVAQALREMDGGRKQSDQVAVLDEQEQQQRQQGGEPSQGAAPQPGTGLSSEAQAFAEKWRAIHQRKRRNLDVTRLGEIECRPEAKSGRAAEGTGLGDAATGYRPKQCKVELLSALVVDVEE